MPSPLEERGDFYRPQLIKFNDYNLFDESANYSSTHPNALSGKASDRDPNDIKGKGTGKYFDTTNGGGFHDINGHPTYVGSGRNKQLASNLYNPENSYPDFEI